ncbi:hypothetical protein PsorP6_015599 [Peronosclerospora sorghi]|uniref:Uncharacterized protein n=1 Tax=Peronosclerospora sorghi TaxID=230839 RepID=A0ACC0WMI3_9STRA|nr:hypothetical protein PsorP6_015599 [Peronosclerospora sorghi]
MALALRIPEEGEFRSRACCDFSSFESTSTVAPPKALFRWSRAVRESLGEKATDAVKVKTLVVAMPGPAQQFVHQLTTSWTVVGTLLTTDRVQPCKLQSVPSTEVILSKTGLHVSEEENCLALLMGHPVPPEATWVWLQKLIEHVDAQEIVCLDSQVSTIYADESTNEKAGTKLRMLATSVVTEAIQMQTPVPALPTPQFITGIAAALLTHGELRQRRVRVFLSLRDVGAATIDVMRSFLPLTASSSSVLGMLERSRSLLPPNELKQHNGVLSVLYA